MSQPRHHIVLVPGFAGFDALGQIEYYAGTTEAFGRWRNSSDEAARARADRATLHYFDNEPSASVAARATRLRSYLAKRLVRNEIQAGDSISLVGHSTGGLDIRRMVSDLTHAPDQALIVDAVAPLNRELLKMIGQVVFLSTPHYGTNLADFVDRVGLSALSRTGLRAVKLGMAVTRALPAKLSQPLLDLIGLGAHWKPAYLDLDALLALLDTYREADEDAFPKVSSDAADARQAHAQFELWVDHMIADFQVVNDLKTAKDEKTTRADPRDAWPAHIATRSYATIGGNPGDGASADTDLLYKLLYRIGRSGPFRAHSAAASAASVSERWFERPSRSMPLDDKSNDGVVNTLSMFFDGGGETFLVAADHGDVIGHYQRVHAEMSAGSARRNEDRPGHRRYASYDFFKSNSGFKEYHFNKLWAEIFDFCAPAKAPRKGVPSSEHKTTNKAV